MASRGTYGYRRIHAELTMAMGIQVCERTVSVLMTRAGIHGLPGPARVRRLRGVATAEDLVNRTFHRIRPNELWVTDITQHRTREGWLYCAAVLDAFSRRIVGWSIDSRQGSTLVVNALDMAIRNRRPEPGGIVHADHGTQFTSWVFGEKIRSAGLLPSFGTVGDGLDNAMMESFWSPMQTELLNRKRWKTRVELANAIFEYIEIFHNRQRRHSALGYRTPHRARTTLRQRHPPRCQLATDTGAQMVGQVRLSPIRAAVPSGNPSPLRLPWRMAMIRRWSGASTAASSPSSAISAPPNRAPPPPPAAAAPGAQPPVRPGRHAVPSACPTVSRAMTNRSHTASASHNSA